MAQDVAHKRSTTEKKRSIPPPVPPKPVSMQRRFSDPPQDDSDAFSTSSSPSMTTGHGHNNSSSGGGGGLWRKAKPVVAPLLSLKALQPRIIESFYDTDDDDDENEDDAEEERNQTSKPIAPSSPLNPLSAFRTFLSPANLQSAAPSPEDDLVLMATGTIDPQCLVTAHTHDSLAQPRAAENVPKIPQAPLLMIYTSLQQKLADLEDRRKRQPHKSKADTRAMATMMTAEAEVKASLNKVRGIHMSATTVPTILQFPPVLIAYQLTLIDSAIFRHIHPTALTQHSPKSPHPAIVASTDFFNYLTRVIEHSILLQQEASARAQHINHWVKVAYKCHELRNFQTLKAIVAALGTPPVQRLKRSWAFVPKKAMGRLESMTELMSERSNYARYREKLLSLSQRDETIIMREPIVPYLGLFMHDATYIGSTAYGHPRMADLLTLLGNLQKHPPYSAILPPFCLKDLNKNKKRKLSLTPGTSEKSGGAELSVEMQQCLVTQYLLTRSWVSEKSVDELSLLREPTSNKYSNTSSANHPISGGSIRTLEGSSALWSSSGCLSLSSASNSSSRPTSLEEEEEPRLPQQQSKFWMFGRKSIDNAYPTSNAGVTITTPPSTALPSHLLEKRLSRHFSFEDLDRRQPLLFRRKKWESSRSSLDEDDRRNSLDISFISSSPHPLD
ncbi:ras guanine nucleotide exchange factor domain-containing protein [Syncephalastrum racemosum]|uniref:Ras guanine nucleotide exchange factor domain-containing protein n=1 Tax=Syncephalastrum racemosum TaxID=13706 RepID=A0A1X2HEA9_SYNRA|nr:ras guanine nucleotide exchange factor domain-containing protein [Syncephalastrum racemosum]